MPLSKDTIKHVSGLARVKLEAGELDELSKQLQDIIRFIDTLKKIDVKDISPTSHILPINTVLREDTPGESLPVDKALGNAPHREGHFFGVPKVIE